MNQLCIKSLNLNVLALKNNVVLLGNAKKELDEIKNDEEITKHWKNRKFDITKCQIDSRRAAIDKHFQLKVKTF